ncbi:hypothetical protein ABT008_17045 [Micromonospora sp. NPDC002389]|uniref:hypothetical protein n=1 Tax=Micromonospora sp. NPDC002389 TaxID=3154272 RepID=UPI003320DD04
MRGNAWIRQVHRWTSIVFTVAVVVVTVVVVGQQEPAEWVYFLPLPPLFLLLFTGLYLFALPYVARRRAARAS